MLSYAASDALRATHRGEAGLAAAPILLFGSLLLGLWRPSHPRIGWLTEVAFAVAALAAGLFAPPSEPISVELQYLPGWLLSQAGIRLELTLWNWSLLAAGLTFVLAHSLREESASPAKGPIERAAWLGFSGVMALAVMAANVLTLLIVWSLAVGMQAWLVRAGNKAVSGTWGFLSLVDLGSFACLMAAAAAPSDLNASSGRSLLLVAGALRLTSGLRSSGPISDHEPRGRPTVAVGGLTAISVLAMLSFALGQEGARALAGTLVTIGAAAALLGAASFWLEVPGRFRAQAWVVCIVGAAVLAAGVSPQNAMMAFSASGAVLLAGGSLAAWGLGGGVMGRVSSMLGTLTSAGVPYLVGAMLLGVYSATGEDSLISSMRWVGILAMAVVSGRILRDVFSPVPGAAAQGSGLATLGLACALMILLSAAMFVYLRSMGPLPSMPALLVSVAVMVGAAVAASRVPGRQGGPGFGKGIRVPGHQEASRIGLAVGRAAEASVRGARDVLEGEASHLWAFVLLLVVFLALRASQ